MLVEAIVATSEEAVSFDGFVAGRGAALWRSAWLLTGDSHRAEDLVQTALARTYPHFARVGAAGFEGYVRTTMYRTYLSWWRRRWNAELPGEVDAGGVDDPDLTVRHDVRRALDALPRQQRAVVVLTYFEDLTGPQAAEVLGVSVGTIKSTLSRALAKLRTSPLLTDGSER
ncbi:MAG: SigE family RNA polymerase sigma factor [Micropruina sp.]|uniref:SigE family RNA polymerase sigma factor n=1 Tax=Micropruina sp. TaxID=2737536 RepID=UPI0039E215F2